MLTDIPAVVPLLKANILLNQLLSHTSTNSALPPPIYDAVTHVWGTPLDPLITTPPTAPSQPSLVVASDVVYDPAGFQPLLTTLQSLLIPSLSTGQGREPYADLVIMAHRHRNPEDHHFFTMVSSEESGLRIQEINLDHIFAKYHQGDNSLRDVQIYHITKQ